MTGVLYGYSGFEMSAAMLKTLRAKLPPEQFAAIAASDAVHRICSNVKRQLELQFIRDADSELLAKVDFLGGTRPCETINYAAGYNDVLIPNDTKMWHGFTILPAHEFKILLPVLRAHFETHMRDNPQQEFLIHENVSEICIFARSPQLLIRFINSALDADLKVTLENSQALGT